MTNQKMCILVVDFGGDIFIEEGIIHDNGFIFWLFVCYKWYDCLYVWVLLQ